ncbi:MAG: hypothetical protein KDA84_30150, partial [Planctomycetaceae bacterium]|nr:hypothetical protein [Planctomycetaceae bacterium]
SVTNADGLQFENTVGAPVWLPSPKQTPESWTLNWKGQSIGLSIRGNESLAFREDEERKSLHLAPVLRAPIRVKSIVDGRSQPTGLQCGWFAPHLDRGHLTLKMQLCREDHTYLDWGRRFLVMVTPLNLVGDPLGNPTVLWESFREPGTGNPTYSWTISDWPTDAESVRLSAWFPSNPAPVQRYNVATLLEDARKGFPIGPKESQELEWQIRTEGQSVTLIERFRKTHGATERHVLQLTSTSLIENATHRRDDRNHVTVHTWKLMPTDFSDCVIERLDLFALKTNALRLEEPVRLPIGKQTSTIPLTQFPRAVITR